MNNLAKNSMWFACFVLACALAVGIRLEYVHRQTGEWRMRPSAHPAVLRYDGHLYDLGTRSRLKDIGFLPQRKDLGGGEILAPQTVGAPQVIQVRRSKSYYEYRLAG